MMPGHAHVLSLGAALKNSDHRIDPINGSTPCPADNSERGLALHGVLALFC